MDLSWQGTEQISLCITMSSYTQPSISGVSGTVFNGSSITISGSAFGTVPQAAPLVWDNFENGTNGVALKGVNGWSAYKDGAGALYNDGASYSGSLSAYNHVAVVGGRGGFATSYREFTALTKLIVPICSDIP